MLATSQPINRSNTIGAKGVFFAVALALLTSGCGESNRASVYGKVALDGKPLEQGAIKQYPTGDTKGPLTGGVITDGEYHIQAANGPLAGHYKVEILSPKTTGKKVPLPLPYPPGTMIDEVVEGIPTKYNTDSTLTADIKLGKNQLDFDMKSN